MPYVVREPHFAKAGLGGRASVHSRSSSLRLGGERSVQGRRRLQKAGIYVASNPPTPTPRSHCRERGEVGKEQPWTSDCSDALAEFWASTLHWAGADPKDALLQATRQQSPPR